MGVDGLKTGHLSISGYGLAASAIDGYPWDAGGAEVAAG